jgi:hypothetical protein
MSTGGYILSDSTNTTNPLVYIENTWTPVVTLVGGAGNTVPVYTTNDGRYTRIGNRVFYDIYLTGDGGAEGAGTGQIFISLPIAANANYGQGYVPVGRSTNGSAVYLLFGRIVGGESDLRLGYLDSIGTANNFTGANQNNTTRAIRVHGCYEV